MNKSVCRICKNKEGNITISLTERMFGLGGAFRYFKCCECGCLQIENQPDNIADFYPRNYYSFSSSIKKTIRMRLIYLRDKYAILRKNILGFLVYLISPNIFFNELYKINLNAKSTILDVGCGAGELIKKLRKLGFKETVGLDLFIEKDLDSSEIKIHKKNITEINGKWDVIMFNHSLEHMFYQQESLQAANQNLAVNGFCIVRIPLVSSYAWNTYGENWFQLDAPRHFYLHSEKSMILLARLCGFVVHKIVYDSTEIGLLGSEFYSKNKALYINDKLINLYSVFPKKIIKKFRRLSKHQNSMSQGDQAIFFLKKEHSSFQGST
ncbi:AdoMet_MTases domain containing protein [Methylophilaceae bacterium]